MTDYFTRVYSGKPCELRAVLSFLFPELSFNQLNKMLRQKDVSVNGKRTTAGDVENGDVVSLYCKPDNVTVNISYSDENYLIAYKKRGLRSDGEYSFEGLVNYKFGSDYILMHRLDTNTDGLLVFAKSQAACELMRKAMDDGLVEKHYYATVHGIVDKPVMLKGWLTKDADKGIVRVFDNKVKGSEYAETYINPLKKTGTDTLLEAVITKGRTHQIRAMLKYFGHFIIGDGKYGDMAVNKKAGFSKQQLTAYKLVFSAKSELGALSGKVVTL